MVLSGCTRTVTRRVARFDVSDSAREPGAAATTQPLRHAALWKVKVRERGEKDYHGIDGTERYLQRGDVVGFRTGEDGVIYAVANREEIPLALTDSHRRVVWYSTEKEPTAFGEGMNEVGALVGTIAIGAAAVAAVGALLVLSLENEDECEPSR
jgi:hypothetical protein